MTSRDAIATALADAFLAGEWTRAGMIDAGARVLGARRRWLGPLARELLAAYHRPPVDRPREVAAQIAASRALTDAWDHARVRGRPLRIHSRPVAATRMVRAHWPVPILNDVADLADLLQFTPGRLDWLADVRGFQRRTGFDQTMLDQRAAPRNLSTGRLHQYRYRWIHRPGRLPRLIEAPTASLLSAQRRLLSEVLAPIPVHPAAHGFVRGRTVPTAVATHAAADVLLRLDLRCFFASISAGRVFGLLRRAGYPEPVAWTMTGLMTLRTPVAVIAAMPAGGDPDERHALRQWLRDGHLPQGAASSPAVANALAYRFDSRCAGYAASLGCAFTRYADDLLFPGDLRPDQLRTLQRAVTRIADDEGFTLNPTKTSTRRRSQRQHALGVVLNVRPSVPRPEYDRLRAILHNAVRTGGPAQNRDAHPDFRAHLAGRIGWVASLDPIRGERLRATFEQITW